ncbi:MAG: YjbE family putative metal transport protein [Acidibrevibacterium sp.]|uniref:YjbE family putative metal transport protein n=1 Tax=Acidibrevibacterium sp. TaxID=2606776 RepID=UPI003CFEB31A
MTAAALLPALIALIEVAAIDLVLAADNAIVVGLAVRGLPAAARRRAMVLGITAATGLRILGGLVALRLLAIIGLTLAGGLLLLWVTWKMYRELRKPAESGTGGAAATTLSQALLRIIAADLSMSLDNVLAVAGAAENNRIVLVAGLALGVVLMAFATDLVARLLARYPRLAWLGWLIVLYIALKMIVAGTHDVLRALPETIF